MRLSIIIIILLIGIAGPASSQIIDFDPDREVTLLPDRLVVSFVDDASEEDARALIREAGFEIERAEFHEVTVHAAADTLLSEEVLPHVRAHPRFASFHQEYSPEIDPRGRGLMERFEAARRIKSIEDEDFDETTPAAVELVIRFQAGTTVNQAREAADEIPGIFIRHIEKRPSSAIIIVDEDDQARAIEVLETSPLVRYVAHLPETEP